MDKSEIDRVLKEVPSNPEAFTSLSPRKQKEMRRYGKKELPKLERSVAELKRQQRDLDFAETLLKENLPHPVWSARLPEDIRKLIIEHYPEKQDDAYDNVVRRHIEKELPVFTVSNDLKKIIGSCDFNDEIPCDYVRMPTIDGCYFHFLEENNGVKGFYLYREDLSTSLSINMKDGEFFQYADIPHTKKPVGEWVSSLELSAEVEGAIKYIVMLLFYCNSAQYRLEQRPEYSEALKVAENKKSPAKKRAASATANKKFDYILINPCVNSGVGGGEGVERSPHFRRGHFRLQNYGPRWSMQKMIFVEPCFVKGGTKVKDYIID